MYDGITHDHNQKAKQLWRCTYSIENETRYPSSVFEIHAEVAADDELAYVWQGYTLS